MGKGATLLSDKKAPSRIRRPTRKAWNRGRLLHTLESKRLLTRISIDAQVRLTIDHMGWDEYWQPARGLRRAEGALGRLESSWSAYVSSGFQNRLQREYCFRYFELLDAISKSRLADPENVVTADVLRRVLAFETFGISLSGEGDHVIAAATSTMRNPVYLLTKLRTPDVLDTGEHLPLILPRQASPKSPYYHYRQHRLSRGSAAALLSYLAVDHEMRPASFRAVGMLEHGLANGTDPFAAERAARLARSGVSAYLQSWCRERVGHPEIPVDLIDLGAGSGLVASRLCSEIARALAELGRSPRFRIWLIDLSMAEPARFFSSRKIARHIDSIQVVRTDYRQWIEEDAALPVCDGVRLVLISRFFNNLSDFSIRPWVDAPESDHTSKSRAHVPRECMPVRCLAPEGDGPEHLIASNARLRLAEGWTFKQFSLSPYFLGLKLALDASTPCLRDEHARWSSFLPVRSFRQACLLTQSRASLLGALASRSNLLVIQDADMRPQDMKEHCDRFDLDDVAVLDTTRAAGLRCHFSYVMGRRTDAALQALKGDRLW